MLEQLALAPGQRVLEIGAGTGYNAALIAQIVGEKGSVVSVDIDADLVARARASLAAAGYPQVRVHCGDGALGVPAHAPYDRIIVTVGAWDLAPDWLAQLARAGRIVLPLSVRGLQLSVALDRAADYLVSRSACSCGFIRMIGSLAGPESFLPLGPRSGLHVLADDGRQLDTSALYAALNGTAVDVPAGVQVADMGDLGDLDLWLAVTETRLVRVSVMGREAGRGLTPAMLPFGGLADVARQVGDFAVAALIPAGAAARAGPGAAATEQGGAPPGQGARPWRTGFAPSARGAAEVIVRGFGPGGRGLADYLAGRALAWHRLGRPGASGLSLRVYPAGAPVPAPAGAVVIDKRHTRLVLGWPELVTANPGDDSGGPSPPDGPTSGADSVADPEG
jgi:protein-L-isoaspartate(D-aspartate) O-methyltransferase